MPQATKSKIKRSKANYDGVDTRQSFTIVDKQLGYRNREDKTLLPDGFMIPGSQNVLIDISGRIKSRKGFSLYGAANTTITPIYAWYEWEEHRNSVINLRVYSGILQFDYNGVWTSILSGLGTEHVQFCNYWDNTEKENICLFVDGSTTVSGWNGAITTYASATTNTITKQGTTTWEEDGFYVNGDLKLMLGGIEYTYSGGCASATLTGVTPAPTAGSQVAGDLIYQSVTITDNSAIIDMLYTFQNDGISNVQNQIYYGSLISNSIYVSQIDNYKSVACSGQRVIGEGALINLRGPWVGFAPQEGTMYIAAGKSQWYTSVKTLATDGKTEAFDIVPLKVGKKQGAVSQNCISHDRNSIIYITNEPRMVALGRVDNIYQTPMITNYSYPISNEFDGIDLTGASIYYKDSYIYITFPLEGKVLIFNQTDPNNPFWEAPQTMAISGFTDINGDLYGHSYSVPETYKLFDGYNDNGHPILSRATYAYNNYGNRGLSDYFNEYWVDGYISANTKLKLILNYDLDGCATVQTRTIDGTTCVGVCILKDDSSLGKSSLGKHGLGTSSTVLPADSLPPYFSVIKQLQRKDFYFLSPTFESYGTDYHWEILTFGPLVTQTMYGNNGIKEY